MEIKKINGEIIFKADKDNIKDAVEEAVKRDVYLRGADLRDADLRGADLRGADLRGADLRDAYLYGAYLYGADLRDADLRGADLRDADLRGADLSGADLYGADLRGAYLYCAGLRGADLRDADLRGAGLRDADLRGAGLRDAYLCGADLYGADLRDADLYGADLSGADLYGADLRGAENIPFFPIACPSDGEFTGWKKVNGLLVELRIPAAAKRSSATTEKCRCDKALVVSITEIKTGIQRTEAVNHNYAETIYHVGEMVYPDSFDENRWHECSNGIHFFTNKESAIYY